jgi:hypothetical protein
MQNRDKISCVAPAGDDRLAAVQRQGAAVPLRAAGVAGPPLAGIHCDFYLPKDSAKAQMLEGKDNLLRLQQRIPPNESELAAVEEGVAAYERLIDKLRDVPTPAGATPHPRSVTVVRM